VGKEAVRSHGMDVQPAPAEQARPVLAETLDHPACPTPPLADEMPEPDRCVRERDRGRLEDRAAAVSDQRPGEDDVLADLVWPATRAPHGFGAVDAERALGHERALEEGLLSLDRRDRQEVIPLLHTGEQVRAGVADEHATGDADGG